MIRSAFTLVELMIVVAIISVLAAIAIPNFVEMQYRAKRAELPTNVDGIRTAEIAFEATMDLFVPKPYVPPLPSGKGKQSWPLHSEYDELGWSPDGDVRGAYSVAVIATGRGDILVTGIGDVDGDGVNSMYTATRSINVVQVTGNDTY